MTNLLDTRLLMRKRLEQLGRIAKGKRVFHGDAAGNPSESVCPSHMTAVRRAWAEGPYDYVNPWPVAYAEIVSVECAVRRELYG